jgi:hypothetical protein
MGRIRHGSVVFIIAIVTSDGGSGSGFVMQIGNQHGCGFNIKQTIITRFHLLQGCCVQS